MDIRIDRGSEVLSSYNEQYAYSLLKKYFSSYPFITSARVFFRGDKHPTKKVKVQLRLKGKDVFAEAEGKHHDAALDNVLHKLKAQMEKYKSKRYKKAS